VARRRSPLPPEEAKSEGSRLLREILRRQTFGAIARRCRCDEGAIRHYARDERKPNIVMRDRMVQQLGIAFESWDEPASKDLYAVGEDPATTRRTLG
jgi:hypothetical protein